MYLFSPSGCFFQTSFYFFLKQFNFDMPWYSFLNILCLRLIWIPQICGLCFHLIKKNLAITSSYIFKLSHSSLLFSCFFFQSFFFLSVFVLDCFCCYVLKFTNYSPVMSNELLIPWSVFFSDIVFLFFTLLIWIFLLYLPCLYLYVFYLYSFNLEILKSFIIYDLIYYHLSGSLLVLSPFLSIELCVLFCLFVFLIPNHDG